MPALPSGSILLWYGSIASIPSGFVLCNGANGTPDLRDKFIVGAGTTYNPGDTGGSLNHTHTFTGDGHNHQTRVGTAIPEGPGFSNVTTTNPAVGTTNPGSSLPPYHGLAYIMKT